LLGGMYAIELEGVSKRFAGRPALENVSLRVDKGSSVLLVGTNGAGKSTLLRCVLGIIGFTGSITVHGLDVRRHGKEVRRMVGYVPQNVRFSENATVEYVVDYVSDLKGVDVYLEEVLAPLGLDKMAGAKVGSLSGGMRQRLAISLALIGDPQILLLDEPFNNLDPMAKNVVAEILMRKVEEGKTVVVSSHTISGLIYSFDVVAVLREGRLVRVLEASEAVEIVKPVYRIHVRSDNGWRTYTTDDLFEKLKELVEMGFDVKNAWIEEPDAEEMLRAIGG
jgi:ABC-type multidrug transport system ATPase subunit